MCTKLLTSGSIKGLLFAIIICIYTTAYAQYQVNGGTIIRINRAAVLMDSAGYFQLQYTRHIYQDSLEYFAKMMDYYRSTINDYSKLTTTQQSSLLLRDQQLVLLNDNYRMVVDKEKKRRRLSIILGSIGGAAAFSLLLGALLL